MKVHNFVIIVICSYFIQKEREINQKNYWQYNYYPSITETLKDIKYRNRFLKDGKSSDKCVFLCEICVNNI
jgi:hypothetical protein